MRKIIHSELMKFIMLFIKDESEITIDDIHNMKLMFNMLGITSYSVYISYMRYNKAHSARVEYKLKSFGVITIDVSYIEDYSDRQYDTNRINITLYPKLDKSTNNVKYRIRQKPESRVLYKDKIIHGVVRAFYGIFAYNLVPDTNKIKIPYDKCYYIDSKDYYNTWIIKTFC